jgi:hypothetical protein
VEEDRIRYGIGDIGIGRDELGFVPERVRNSGGWEGVKELSGALNCAADMEGRRRRRGAVPAKD